MVIKSDDLISRIQSEHSIPTRKKFDESLSINIFNADHERSTTGLNGHFIHSQLLIDCLLRMKPTATEQAELVAVCREEFKNKAHEISHIDDFEQNYTADRAIWWYTRPSFLYRLLNKALRVQNIDRIYNFRFFIRDLHQQLSEHQSSATLRVYRGQLMTKKELAVLQGSVDKFISINSFFSTSFNRELALLFVRNVEDCERVLFQIDASPQSNGDKPFANIAQLSSFPDESEVLFMLGSIFRVANVNSEDNSLWTIHLTLSSDDDYEIKPIFEHMKNRYSHQTTDLLAFGHVLRGMGKFEEAENYYQQLLDRQSTDQPELAACYHALGIIKYEMGDYAASLKWHQKALQRKLCTLSPNDASLASSYNSIGTIYERQKDYGRALRSFHKALTILQQAFGGDHPKVATCLNNIAGIYQTEKKYQEALEHNEIALKIREKHLPADHPDLGATHSNIGVIYRCLEKYDCALKHYEQSLKIQEKSLPSQHPLIAATLNNTGLIYEDKHEHPKALSYYQKAALIYRKALPATHPNVVKIEQLIRRVKWKMK